MNAEARAMAQSKKAEDARKAELAKPYPNDRR